jgi:diaminopimelate decarboxylase
MARTQPLDAARCTALAARFGTPLFVYDAEVLAASFGELREALPPAVEIFYSLKANPNVSVVGVLAAAGARAEVCSRAELRTALLAGIDPADIIFLGPSKSAADLEACLTAGIYAIVAESFDELGELDRIARSRRVRPRVMLRVNPRRGTTGAGLSMGGKPRQFGIDESQLEHCGSVPERFPQLDVCGIHVYLGTRLLDASLFTENVRATLELAERIAAVTGIRLAAVDVGGGIGVAYFAGESDPDLSGVRAELEPLVASFRQRHPRVRLMCESGRFLAARAGEYVVRVGAVKQSMGQWFASTDGGTHHHQAAAGIGSVVPRNFPVRLLNRTSAAPAGAWQVTGSLCTPNDTLARNVELPQLQVGDLIGIGRSGAYAASASPGRFLSHGYAAEVLLHDGDGHLVRRRDNPLDLLRGQHYHHVRTRPMERRQAIEHIRVAVEKVTRRDLPALDADTPLPALGLDSTGMLELLMELEDLATFVVDPDDLDPEVFRTVGTLCDYLTRMASVP